MPALKNARHERFAQELARGKSADFAYQEAGFKPNRGNSGRLKSNERIQARVAELIGNSANRAEIDIARVLKELTRLATSDLRRLYDENGNLRPLHELDDETAAAVSSVEVISRTVPGKDEVERVHKVKLWDKNSALEKIAKHFGMFIERFEHSGPGGGPIETKDVSPRDEIDRRIAGITARVGKKASA